jgi:hypothetical protein
MICLVDCGRRNVVEHGSFKIGLEFWMSGSKWRVTDIGTRTIIAIRLDRSNPSRYNGPPYAIPEHVIDEYDLPACSLEKSVDPHCVVRVSKVKARSDHEEEAGDERAGEYRFCKYEA